MSAVQGGAVVILLVGSLLTALVIIATKRPKP